MKAVLLSIRPEWCVKIAAGKKTVEIRKSRPKQITPFKCYIYCTKSSHFFPNFFSIPEVGKGFSPIDGKVIGEFVCDEVYKVDRDSVGFNFTAPSLDLPVYTMPENNDEYRNVQREELTTCLTDEQLSEYLGIHPGWGWHISDLKIYDRPRKLTDFLPNCRFCEEGECEYRRVYCEHQNYDYNPDGSVNVVLCDKRVRKAPQSWCYVEELKDV